jgi:hypothetical protein
MARPLVQLLLFVCVAANSIFGAQAKSPWLGVWSARLGEYGIIAFSIGDKGDGVPARAEVWWLADVLRPTGIRIEGDTLFIDLSDHKRASMPGFALRLTDKGTLQFFEHGVLPAPLDPLYAAIDFTHPKDMFFWNQNLVYQSYSNEWSKWHESGRLKPLPADWPASVTSPLLRLFAYNDHLFHRVVVLPSLSEADLSAAYAWTHDKNIWSNGPDYIRQRIGQNLNTPLPILTELWNHPDNSQFWIAAAQNPRAPAEWRTALIDRILSGSDSAQSRAIWTGDAPPELYLKLIEQKPALRSQIAGNREMPAAVYETLARDYPQDSLRNLIANPAVPIALLEKIASSADRTLQLTLINNPSLPASTRTRLVRQILAQSTAADFARFVHDHDATPEFLARCATDLEPGIRTYVAQNPNTPELLLLTLAEDASRPVAEAARSALKSRFPATLAQRQSGFTPLNSRAENVPLYKQFENAITSSDLATLRHLASYHAERNQLDGILSQNARHVIRGGYRPTVMDLFLELGFARDRGHLASLAGQCGGNAEWIAYFKKHDAFAKTYAARAYRAALESKDPANLAGLLIAGIDPNQPDDESRTALHTAILRNDLSAAKALLDHGANRAAQDRQQRTPLDYAVLLKSITAIRLLDTNGQHAALIADFVKEFPPAPSSTFLGNWTNNKDGFYTVSIALNADGSGRFGGGVIGGLLAWREVSSTEAVAFLFNEKGEVMRNHPIKLSLETSTQVLTFIPPKGEVQQMIRPPNQ